MTKTVDTEDVKPKLLSCPFCGGDIVQIFFDDISSYHKIYCCSCGAHVEFIAKPTKDATINMWNTRFIADSQEQALHVAE